VLTATSRSYAKAKISDPHRIETPNPICIKFGTVDYVRETTPCAKFYRNPSMGASRRMGKIYIYAKFIFIYTFFRNLRTHQTPQRDYVAETHEHKTGFNPFRGFSSDITEI